MFFSLFIHIFYSPKDYQQSLCTFYLFTLDIFEDITAGQLFAPDQTLPPHSVASDTTVLGFIVGKDP